MPGTAELPRSTPPGNGAERAAVVTGVKHSVNQPDVWFAGKRVSRSTEGVYAMTEYLIAAILFVAMITTLVYLWKREHG